MEKLPNFSSFSENLSTKKLIKEETKIKSKLKLATEKFHQSQLDLQQLQLELIETSKENISKREELKKAIIAQKGIVKKNENEFNKFLGDEDIKDLKI
jgi:hypothetical protein